MDGRIDFALDSFWLIQDDAWERVSRQMALQFNLKQNSISNCKPPKHFNDLANWLEDAGAPSESATPDNDGFLWAEAEEARKAKLNG